MDAERKRTRFLAQLDEMLMQDRTGAIADMLQVLRERRVLKTAHYEQSYDTHFENKEGFADHIRRDVAMSLADFLLNEGAFVFEESRQDPPLNLLRGSIEVVNPDSPRSA